jgi:hypothetical protein
MHSSKEDIIKGWKKLHKEGAGMFNLGIFKPQDVAQMAMSNRDLTRQQCLFLRSLSDVVDKLEEGDRPRCFCCGGALDGAHAIVVMLPDTDHATVALSGVLCRQCGNGTYHDAQLRVLRYLKEELMTDLIVMEHDAGRA